MDRDESLINGPGVQPPASVDTLVPRDVTGDALRQGVAQVGRNIDGLSRTIVEMEDSTKQFEQERALMLMQDEVNSESKRRLQLPDGDPEAFFDERGNFSQVAVRDFLNPYRKTLEGIGSGIMVPERAQNMRMKAALMGDRMLSNLMDNGFEVSKKKQRQSLEANLALAEETNNWGWYGDTVREAVKSGAMEAAQGDLLLFGGKKKSFTHQFADLAATNPSGAYDLLDSEGYKNLFSPAELESMRRGLASHARPAAADSFYNSFVLTKKVEKGKDSGPEWTGFFTEKECGYIHAIEAGKGSVVRPQIAAAAAEEARAFNPSLSNEESEVARDAYIQKYSMFGLEKEWLGRQWTAADKMRKELKTPTIDIKGRLDLLEKRGSLLNQSAFNSANHLYSNKDGWGSGGKFRDEFMGQLGLKGTEDAEYAMAKYMAYARASHAAGLRSQIDERFHSWRQNDGKDATQAEQQAKLITITRDITGNRDISFVDKGVNQMDSYIANAVDAQRSKFAQWAVKSGRKYWVDSTAQEPPMQRVSLGFDSAQKNLPAGILLPKSMMEGFDHENGVVEATFDNKHFRRFRVVGTCEGDAPQMSYAVARDGFYDAGRSFAVDMRVIKGDTEQLMKQQEAALPSGKSVKVNEAKLGGLAPYKQAFIDAGKKYGMTPDQVKIGMSIAMQETGRGSSHAFRTKNNSMGISPNGGGPRSFGSVEEGIDYGMRNLKKNYFDKGLTTLEQIGAVYAPIGANNDPGNLNRYWSTGVRKNYNSL